jgi:hypothetical protein
VRPDQHPDPRVDGPRRSEREGPRNVRPSGPGRRGRPQAPGDRTRPPGRLGSDDATG